jgi:hypothetical protein
MELPHEVLERNLQGALAIWVLQKPKRAPSWLQTSYNENLWQSLNPLSLKRSHVKDCKTPNACPAEKAQFIPVFVSSNHRLCFALVLPSILPFVTTSLQKISIPE